MALRFAARIGLSRTKQFRQLRLLTAYSSGSIPVELALARRLTSSAHNGALSGLNRAKRIAQLHFQQASTQATERHKIVPFILPDIGEGISEVEIKHWQIKLGDSVKEFDAICEVESDKATATISSRFEGTIVKIHYEVGHKAKVGTPLVDIQLQGATSESQRAEDAPKVTPTKPPDQALGYEQAAPSYDKSLKTEKIFELLPSVRRLAREANVDLNKVTATGKNGRILKENVLAYIDRGQHGNEEPSPSAEAPKSTAYAGTTVVPLKGIRKAMFKTMTQSLTIPHFNYSDEVDMTRLLDFSRTRRHLMTDKSKETPGLSISNLSFMLKMLSLSLLEYPELNASIDAEGQNLVHKHYHNIGVAIDSEAGLVVPSIKNVQDLSVIEVDNELKRLRELSYKSKLGAGDLAGGTISVSNIGAIGGVFGVPVIVSPEIVICALGKIQKLPRFNSVDQIEARQMMQIVWSADHRVVDGATLSRFSNLYKELLENPEMCLLRMK